MQVNLFNSKNPNGPLLPVSISLEQVDDTSTKDGEVIYVVILSCNVMGSNGELIEDVVVNGVTESNLKQVIERGLTAIGSQVDWGVLEEDKFAPILVELHPRNNEKDVSIHSNISLRMKDPFPASLINLASIRLYVNGVEETNKIAVKQVENEVKVTYVPFRVLNND